MVAWLYETEKRQFRPKLAQIRITGLPLLACPLPPGDRDRRLAQAGRLLRRRGVSRVLSAPALEDREKLSAVGLAPVESLPLCRAKGADLALALLSSRPVRERRIALRGAEADRTAWALAETLCPQTGALLLDFDRGEEALAGYLRERYGAVALHLGQGPPPQASLEFSPRRIPAGRTLRLWGSSDLQGLSLSIGCPLPPDLPRLPFLALLWETGRISLKEIQVVGREE